MIRIISGVWKGKRILAPKNFIVRPTTDFAKEALFSLLSVRYDFQNIKVLDLFSGIGSISYEFASRGCNSILSVDNNGHHIKFISETAKILGFDQIYTIKYDAQKFIENQSENSFDIIFADPPYEFSTENYQKLIDTIFQKNLLTANGLFILEHQSKTKPYITDIEVEIRKYGNVGFSLFGK